MRSVVFKGVPRCARCRLPDRWCVCAGQVDIHCPLAIDLLMHHREQNRPSSTGTLIQRLLPEARTHLWRHDLPVSAAVVQRPGRELWILHPHGEPPPVDAAPDRVQVLLLDGSWSETSTMAKAVGSWGRLVGLPMTGRSRYWLRDQQDGGRFSTVEALLFLLQRLGLDDAHQALRVQFELHVYASLRARGRKETAAEFLRDSPLGAALPGLLEQLHVRRPRESA